MTIDTEHFKKKLEEEKALVERGLSSVGARPTQDHINWKATLGATTETADKNVAADRHEDYEERHAITDELEIRFSNIKAALKKIDEGKYGICEIGGEEIEVERLEANPSAKTCKKHLND